MQGDLHSENNAPEAVITDPRRARNIIILLAASVAVMMTGYGIIVPVMAKRLAELGAGVETLGFMTMAFAVGQLLLAPFMGSLADRFGRRPLILIGLAGEIVANLLFLSVNTTGLYIAVRFFQGAISAGLLPASMGIVGDIFPENKRAQWVGILMGSYGIGFIFGPGLGGLLYDNFGFVAPFGLSAALALLSLILTILMVPETRPATVRAAQAKLAKQAQKEGKAQSGVIASLPRPLYLFGVLLSLDFLAVFVFAFIEPQLAFFIYDKLKFTSTEFGILVSAYGLAMAVGQLTLGKLSDRYGRKLLIGSGFLLNGFFYLGLTLFTEFWVLLVIAMLAGLGNALILPALSAYYLDISSEQHRSRIMGIKEAVAALGGAIGPLLVAVVSGWTTPQGIFTISAVLAGLAIALAMLVLKGKKPQAEPVLCRPTEAEMESVA